jgi:glutamate N-acetyltransferase/amino-acid N-acetyltransferase
MSVTYPKGFTAVGLAAGIKATGAKDLAIVLNTGNPDVISAAAVFTTNRFAAAPVRWSRQALASGAVPRAVVLNSGGANACTGQRGDDDAAHTAASAAIRLGLDGPDEVLVCSTGLIGVPLPMDVLLAGLAAAAPALSRDGGPDAAEAIRTTDTRAKTVAVETQGYRIGGMAKGAGMLAPELATMLVVLTTDALLDGDDAQRIVRQAAATTFGRIDSDGCMSTNDTVILLISGASGIRPEPSAFAKTLTGACANLAAQLIDDAEGASHDIAIKVVGAVDETAALAVCRAVARSNLVKAAIFGRDPNWGRILSATGTVPADVCPFDADKVDVSVNGVRVCRGGGIGDDRDLVNLAPRAVDIVIDVHAGPASATVLTNDLTYDYVKENAEYSS